MLTTFPGRPSQPRGLTVTEVTDSSVSLRWSRPETDGGKPITRYVVERRDAAKSTYMPVGTTPPDSGHEFRVIRLVAGSEYVLRVSAENEVGVGDPAELSHGITAKSPYCESINRCLLRRRADTVDSFETRLDQFWASSKK